MCRSHISRDKEPALFQKIDQLYIQMKTYENILEVDKTWKDWQSIQSACKEDPAKVIRRLLDNQQHELARTVFSCSLFHSSDLCKQISELFGVANIKNEIEESYLFSLFNNNGSYIWFPCKY